MAELNDVTSLLSAAMALGAGEVPGWSASERQLVENLGHAPSSAVIATLRKEIEQNGDPLGDAFCRLHSAVDRRQLGQTYTPASVVSAMVNWAATRPPPARIVDPGIGSGRYLVAAGRQWKSVPLLGIDIDPLSAILARGHLAGAGLAERAQVLLVDYRELEFPKVDGPTLYLGNPPYVRHHQISPRWKQWLTEQAKLRNLPVSALAGLHAYFFLATARLGQPGDFGSFVTSAEWLDVNYGRLIRSLLLEGLGGQSIHVLDPTISVFADAITTSAITCFEIGSKPNSMQFKQVKNLAGLGSLTDGRKVSRARLIEASRWSPLTQLSPKISSDEVELGELCKVHRGQVTGDNSTWVVSRDGIELPSSLLFPAITRARELFAAGERLTDDSQLKLIVDLPVDLDELSEAEREAVEKFLSQAKIQGAADGYIARNRRAWWSVGLRAPAPILATYMARRPPAFVLNEIQARHINIAHGLYPRIDLPPRSLKRLAQHLRTSVTMGQGRTYGGGLTKFEPREMERLRVPTPEVLLADAPDTATDLD